MTTIITARYHSEIFMAALDGIDATFVSLQKEVRPRDSQVLQISP